MMYLLGWFVFLIFSILVTLSPIPVIALSSLGGGLKRGEVILCVLAFVGGCFFIYKAVKASPFILTIQ